jgi:hypothetical protein
VSVAKALLFRQKAAESKSDGDLQGIELAVNILEKQLKGLDDMETWSDRRREESSPTTLSGKAILRKSSDA